MSALTLDDAMTHLNITVDTYDGELQAVIDSAEAMLAQRVGPLEATTVTRRIPGCTSALVLPVTPAIELTSVTPNTGSALTVADLYLDGRSGLVTRNDLGSFTAAFYDVVYEAGRATCPDDLLFAVKELVRHLWRTQRGGSARPGSTDSQQAPGYLIPYAVAELLAPHVQIGVG